MPRLAPRIWCLSLALVACVSSCTPGDGEPEVLRVETAFTLEAPEVYGSVPWRCAVALETGTRSSPALFEVFNPDAAENVLEAPVSRNALTAVMDALQALGTDSVLGVGGVDGARSAIDAGLTAIVPFSIPGGARCVLVSGYRTVEAEDGSCTPELQDILVVDTVEVMAYGMPVADYRARLAGPGVVAVTVSPDDADRLDPERFRRSEPTPP